MWHDRRWSWFLGSWGRTGVWLHASVLPILFGSLYLGWLADREAGQGHACLTIAGLVAACWFISVTIHELARGAVARATGVEQREIVIGPVGDLVGPTAIPHVRAAFWTALSGPVAHWALATVAAAILLLMGTPWDSFGSLLHPFRPDLRGVGPPYTFSELLMRLVFWCNWLLLLLHLLPAWPFDGVQIWQYGLLSLFPDLSRRSAAAYVSHAARWTTVGLLVLAWCVRHDGALSMMPSWLPLVGLAAIVYLHARVLPSPVESPWKEIPTEPAEPVGAEVAAPRLRIGDEELESHDADDPFTASWWHQQRQRRKERRRRREQEEDQRVDEILRRVHEVGLEGISRSERDLLMRVSQRWREQRRHDRQGESG